MYCRIKPVVCLFKPCSVSVVKLTYYWQCNLIFNKYRWVRIDYILMKDLSNLLYNSLSVHKTIRCSLLVFHIRVEPSTVEVELTTVDVELTTVDVKPSTVEIEHHTSKSNFLLSKSNLLLSMSNLLVSKSNILLSKANILLRSRTYHCRPWTFQCQSRTS